MFINRVKIRDFCYCWKILSVFKGSSFSFADSKIQGCLDCVYSSRLTVTRRQMKAINKIKKNSNVSGRILRSPWKSWGLCLAQNSSLQIPQLQTRSYLDSSWRNSHFNRINSWANIPGNRCQWKWNTLWGIFLKEPIKIVKISISNVWRSDFYFSMLRNRNVKKISII